MDRSVVWAAQQDQVVERGLAAIGPVPNVVRGGVAIIESEPGRGPEVRLRMPRGRA